LETLIGEVRFLRSAVHRHFLRSPQDHTLAFRGGKLNRGFLWAL